MSVSVPGKFTSPSLTILHCATGCGKSRLCFELLKHCDAVYDRAITRILYCYSAYQPLFMEMEKSLNNIIFHKGLPDSKYL